MKARQSVLLVATLLCSMAPLCAMGEAASDETVNAVEMNVAMPEANDSKGVAVVDENADLAAQPSQAPLVKKPVVSDATSMGEVIMEEAVAPSDVAVEEASMVNDNSADVRGVFEEMSREEVGDQMDEVDHIG